ncbi:hypothetical protein FB45DRAFT_779333 [Roridomyces roridus]|uniref:Arylesterase n=1 Tax=Roridomyces roridus TaxID=1738132 RepID=A0AAD7CIY9_9AGAR|nr:hypothetical protein FB45DRAFT_779333 [Roridomyces roridus]
MSLKFKTAFFIAALSIVGWRSGRAGYQMFVSRSSPKSYYAGNPDSCILKTAPGFEFCEDAAFWDVHGNASLSRSVLVSCDPGRKGWNTVMGPLLHPDPHGSLWLVKVHTAEPQRLELNNYPANHDFHPLGMAVSPSYGNGDSNLFVVNHARARTVIEQFTLSPSGVATHVRTLSSPFFVSPNSIALTSPDSFYVTNDHLMTRRLPSPFGHVLPMVETLFGLPLGWVSHITLDPDTTSSTPIKRHEFSALFIPFANGVSISPSGSQVAVASSSLGEVFLFSRDQTTNLLSRTKTVPLPFLPDNLDFDETGTVIVAGHPHFLSLIKVKSDPTPAAVAPSWIASVNPEDSTVETLFRSDGTFFSSSSTGLRDFEGVLWGTGLYATEGLLICGASK